MIRIGTCSWEYDSWKVLIYPTYGKFNYLSEYAKHFNTVEIDQWFWSLFADSKIVLPQKKTVSDYSNSVPEDFLFTIKVPNSITLTHYYRKTKNDQLIKNPYFLSDELFNKFLEVLKPITNKIGCLIFQFEYLNKEKIKDQKTFQLYFKEFKEKIVQVDLPVGVEIRNPNYLNKNFFQFLHQVDLIPVLLHGYYMPSVIETCKSLLQFEFDKIIFRLHGPDRSGIEKVSNKNWNQIYIDRESEISQLAELFRELQNKKVDLFVNVNNHFEGSAPLTIKRIKQFL